MSILLSGIVTNVYQQPEGVSKRTGEAYGGGWRVEILADFPLENGQMRNELVTLKIEASQRQTFDAAKGRRVNLPIGIFAKVADGGKADLILFIQKGVKLNAAVAA